MKEKVTSPVTKVILNDLQGKKRVVWHDVKHNKIKVPKKTREERTQKTRPRVRRVLVRKNRNIPFRKPSVGLIGLISSSLILLLIIGTYSYHKNRDREVIKEMVAGTVKTTSKSIESLNKMYNDEIQTLASLTSHPIQATSFKRPRKPT